MGDDPLYKMKKDMIEDVDDEHDKMELFTLDNKVPYMLCRL
jgi:hypothetical protein